MNSLNEKANEIRKRTMTMIGPENKGHYGGSCSIAEIVAVLYFDHMRLDYKDPDFKDRDLFLLSKGHAALAQYAALSMIGYIDEEELKHLKEFGYMLQGHPDMRKIRGIECNTGSLGQGLSMACGMAAASMLDGKDNQVYCIVGDGEMQEGQIYEAMMSASAFGLHNLCVILDANRLQATSRIEDGMNHYPLLSKAKSFSFNTIEIDGHSVKEIKDALIFHSNQKDAPTFIQANTIKGKGILGAENVCAFHNGVLDKEGFIKAYDNLNIKGEV
jgi:transketolase